jgi:LPXTG-motif cell wall-anchored protein
VTKEATATTKGEKTWTCQVCGETKIVETPALGTSNSGSGDKTTGTANTKPQTGDETNVALWVVMMSVCAAGVVLTVSKKKTDK